MYYNKPCKACTKTYNWYGYGSDLDLLSKNKDLKCPWCMVTYSPDKVINPKTQKAKGMLALYDIPRPPGGESVRILPIVELISNVKEKITSYMEGTWFARPCPPSPEHGFVESRVVKSLEELEQVRVETLAANEDSEIMLTPLINATWNAVWVPSLLSVGPGHDGATAGKGVINVPLSGINPLSAELMHTKGGIKDDCGPYIEAVGGTNGMEEDATWLTQLRGGPILPSGVGLDYVPADIDVLEVVKTNNEDLLEWAKVVKNLKGKPGVIVWHPGGGLTDHYSVHCRENQVPIVISFEPVPGLVLESSNFTQIPPHDPQAILAGLACVDKMKMDTDKSRTSFATLCLLALHNSSVMRGPAGFWIGVGVGALLKLGSAALRVEARHAHNLPKGLKGKPDGYTFYCAKPNTFHRAGLSRVTQILHYGFGDPSQSKSFGGLKWALCGAAMAPVFNSVRALALEPTESNASQLVMDLNVAINQAHNGGWWLNKFIPIQAYNEIPKGDPVWTITCVQAIFEVSKARNKVNIDKFIETVKTWRLTEIKPLSWRRASLDVGPGSFVLNLKAATLPVAKQITIPTTPGLMKSLVEHLGEILITNGNIDLITKQGETINLWKEETLNAKLRNPNDRSTW